MWRYFNEILEFPVSAATVRGLATRWLLGPPEIAAVAASAGMAGVPIGTTGNTEATTLTLRPPQAAMRNSSSTDTTNLVSSLPGVEWGVGTPSQQQHQHQQGDAVWDFPSSADSGKMTMSPPSHLPDFCTSRCSKGGGVYKGLWRNNRRSNCLETFEIVLRKTSDILGHVGLFVRQPI